MRYFINWIMAWWRRGDARPALVARQEVRLPLAPRGEDVKLNGARRRTLRQEREARRRRPLGQ